MMIRGDAVTAAASPSARPSAIEQEEFTVAIDAIVEQRAVIEQAKGMLMLIHGVDADEAFALLRRHSQDNNVKLRCVAEQLARDLVDLSRSQPSVRRLASDAALLTTRPRAISAVD